MNASKSLAISSLLTFLLAGLSGFGQNSENKILSNYLLKGISNEITLDTDEDLSEFILEVDKTTIPFDSVCTCFYLPVKGYGSDSTKNLILKHKEIVFDTLIYEVIDVPGISAKVAGKTSEDNVIAKRQLLMATGLELEIPFGLEGFEISSYKIVSFRNGNQIEIPISEDRFNGTAQSFLEGIRRRILVSKISLQVYRKGSYKNLFFCLKFSRQTFILH